jgi:hypothetical protein
MKQREVQTRTAFSPGPALLLRDRRTGQRENEGGGGNVTRGD